MKSVILRQFGGADTLIVENVQIPEASEGQVLVRVEASGINYFETLMRAGRYGFTPELPIVLGVEVAGVVAAVGEKTDIAIGSHVAVPLFAIGKTGGYAQYVVADAATVHPVPEGLSSEDAVALLVQGLTALHAVRRSSPEGKTVLIPAAAGGVGTLLLQLARLRGARKVLAVAGTEEKLEVARRLGADDGVAYNESGWGDRLNALAGERSIDIVYDFVGGELHQEYLKAVAPEGEILFGALGRAEIERDTLNALIGQNLTLKGMALIPLLTPEGLRSDLAELFARARNGEIKVLIGARIPIDDVAKAHTLVESRQTTGKTVLLL